MGSFLTCLIVPVQQNMLLLKTRTPDLAGDPRLVGISPGEQHSLAGQLPGVGYTHPTVKRTPLPLARVPVFLCIAARKYSRLLVKCSSFLRKYSRLLVKCSSFLRKYSRLLVKYSSCLRKYSRLLVKCSSLRVCVSLRRFS